VNDENNDFMEESHDLAEYKQRASKQPFSAGRITLTQTKP